VLEILAEEGEMSGITRQPDTAHIAKGLDTLWISVLSLLVTLTGTKVSETIVKGRTSVRLAANAIGQDLCDTPLEETSCREVSPNQVDIGWVQALVAQEMKKWMQGKQS